MYVKVLFGINGYKRITIDMKYQNLSPGEVLVIKDDAALDWISTYVRKIQNRKLLYILSYNDLFKIQRENNVEVKVFKNGKPVECDGSICDLQLKENSQLTTQDMPSISSQEFNEVDQSLLVKFSKAIDFTKDNMKCSDSNSTAYYIDLGNVQGHCVIQMCSA